MAKINHTNVLNLLCNVSFFICIMQLMVIHMIYGIGNDSLM